MKKIITVIDLGSSKIAAAIAGIDKDGRVSLLALENLYSHGMQSGNITDINKAVNDISSIMVRLKRHQRKKIKNVFVTIKGIDVKMDIGRGTIPLSKTSREITKRDVNRCLDIAAMVKLPLDRTIIEKVVKGFCIDGGSFSVTNPIGLYGVKLEAETFIATANQSKIQNITKCIDFAGLILDGIYLSGLASANSVLEAEEKEKGVFLLDIGESLAEGLIFKHGMLKNFHIIKQGATSILGNGMHVNKQKLCSLLKKANSALRVDSDNFVSIVVTGGGALLDGIIEETEKVFKIPARIGLVKKERNLNSRDAIIHTSTIGLIDYLAKEYKTSHIHNSPIHKAFRKILGIYESYF